MLSGYGSRKTILAVIGSFLEHFSGYHVNKLPLYPSGDSDSLKVGEQVVAIGNAGYMYNRSPQVS